MAVNGLTAAKGLARSIESAGGIMRISVPALGDAFGRGKMTARAKTGIEQVLAKSGVVVEPGLNDPANDGWVTLRLESMVPHALSAPSPSQPAPLQIPETTGVITARRPATFILGALGLLVAVMLVVAFASPDANRPGRAAADQPQQATPLERADDALLAGDYRLAVRLTQQADAGRVPALRAKIAGALVQQARAAQRQGAYVKAIQLSRRAARYGRAPGASQIIRQSRAGLDLRRAEQRRTAGN